MKVTRRIIRVAVSPAAAAASIAPIMMGRGMKGIGGRAPLFWLEACGSGTAYEKLAIVFSDTTITTHEERAEQRIRLRSGAKSRQITVIHLHFPVVVA